MNKIRCRYCKETNLEFVRTKNGYIACRECTSEPSIMCQTCDDEFATDYVYGGKMVCDRCAESEIKK